MKKALTFSLCVVLCGLGTASVAAMGTAFTYQGLLQVSGEPADGSFDFGFRLYDALTEGKMVGSAVSLRGVAVTGGIFTVPLDFGAAAFDGSPRWLEIAVAPFVEKRPAPKTTLTPRQPVTATPYAIRAQSLSGTIDVSQITGLLGQGYTMLFPDVLYNQTGILVMANQPYWFWSTEHGVILTGPGVDIDRIPGSDAQGHPADNPGFAQEYPIVFEAADPEASVLKTYIDTNPNFGLTVCSPTVPFLSGQVFLHLDVLGTVRPIYTSGVDGRTRFTFTKVDAPDRIFGLNFFDAYYNPGDFGNTGSYNPTTDMKVEISVLSGLFFPEVAVDEAQRTLTLTYSSNEGYGIYRWVKRVVEGNNEQYPVSVIRLDAVGNEIGRDNYVGCFPIKYEIFEGFALNTTLRARVVLSYNRRNP